MGSVARRAWAALIMDVSDQGTQQEEFARAAALSHREPVALFLTGRCGYCEEHTGGLFCNIDCRNDWQREQDAKKRAGR